VPFQFVETRYCKSYDVIITYTVFIRFFPPEPVHTFIIHAFSHFLCERSLLTSDDKQMLGYFFKDEFPFGTGKQEY